MTKRPDVDSTKRLMAKRGMMFWCNNANTYTKQYNTKMRRLALIGKSQKFWPQNTEVTASNYRQLEKSAAE
jgi:hypothetical protein